jgi:hypothetical protein
LGKGYLKDAAAYGRMILKLIMEKDAEGRGRVVGIATG